nr:PRD domain-containing protein [Symbiobacterium thermophilum]
MLFLDEIHRLPPDGQEMLFLLMDRGVYRALGDTATRQASVMLVGATSEDPSSSLLNTFVRRFPVVIHLPGLDVRPVEERLALIEVFLREEASRIGKAIVVSPLVLLALLAYRTTGNVGELRSAILMACAKAFFAHAAAGLGDGAPISLDLTHLSPQIQLAYLQAHESSGDAERLVGVEDRVYRPSTLRSQVRYVDDYVPADLYAQLHRRVTGYLRAGLQESELRRVIQTDLDYYLRRLLHRADRAGVVSNRLLEIVTGFVREVGDELNENFGSEVVTGLALHLAARSDHDLDVDQALALVAQCPAEYAAVNRLAPRLEAELGVRLLPGEKSFLALFLAAHRPRNAPSGLQVMVIAHGDSTASSMAAVANELLGTDIVTAVDMPLEQSVQATVELAAARVRAFGPVRGVVLLVDMGSLTGLGPALERETGVPFAVVPLVTTPAVIEAARVAQEPGSDLATVVRAVRRVYTGQEEEPVVAAGKRLVITTCLTGQGTARKLAAFLTEALPPDLRESVAVQAVDLDNGSVLPGLLVEGWRKGVVAVVGTIDPRLPGVPFIGLERVLFGDGLQALADLLRGEEAPAAAPSATREEAMELSMRFLVDNIASVDGRRAGEAAAGALRRFEESLGMRLNANRVARWIIHLGFAIERLASDGTTYPCPEEEYLRVRHGSLLSAIADALEPVGRSWGFSFPSGEVAYMALIVLTE